MKRKIVFVDMDGTLFQTENGIVQDSSLAALKQFRDNGYLVAAATGRPLNQMKSILEEADHFDFDYYVLINGGYILDGNFQLIDSNPIPENEVREIVQMAQDNKLGLMFHFGDASYIYNDFYPVYNFCKYTNALEGLFYDPTQSYHKRHQAYNSLIVTKSPDVVQQFVAAHPDLRLDLINVKTDGFAYDVFNAQNDKSHGIEAVLKREGIDWKDVVAIGDSTNDIPMLQKAGIGVAMGTASDEVKAAADYVTSSVYSNGVWNAMKHILNN